MFGPRATQLALMGRSLTEVAHAAGYFDSAHFSRQFQGLTGAIAHAPWTNVRR